MTSWAVVGIDNGGTTNNATVLDSDGNFLVNDLVGDGRIQAESLSSRRRQFARGSLDARPREPPAIDRVSQRDVAVNPGMSYHAHGSEAGFQVFARIMRAEKHPRRWTHSGSAIQDGFLGEDGGSGGKQVCVAID